MDARARSQARADRQHERETHGMREVDRSGIEGRDLITGPYHAAHILRENQAAANEKEERVPPMRGVRYVNGKPVAGMQGAPDATARSIIKHPVMHPPVHVPQPKNTGDVPDIEPEDEGVGADTQQ